MIITLENRNIFKTNITNNSLKDKILADIQNKTELSFEEPVRGMTSSSILQDYLQAIAVFKNELNLTGTPTASQAWFMTYARGDSLVEHHNTTAETQSFTAVHYLKFEPAHKTIHFLFDNKIVESNDCQENDLIIFPSDYEHGLRPHLEKNSFSILLFFTFTLQ